MVHCGGGDERCTDETTVGIMLRLGEQRREIDELKRAMGKLTEERQVSAEVVTAIEKVGYSFVSLSPPLLMLCA